MVPALVFHGIIVPNEHDYFFVTSNGIYIRHRCVAPCTATKISTKFIL